MIQSPRCPFFSLLCALFLLCIHSSLSAQSLEEILQKHKEAVRSTEDTTFIQSTIAKGEMNISSIIAPITVWTSHHRSRMEATFNNLTMFFVQNDSLTWQYNPVTQQNVVTKKTHSKEGSMNLMKDDIIHYPDNGITLTLKGKVRLDSIPAYALKVVTREGERATFYIDRRNYLICAKETATDTAYFLNYVVREQYVYPSIIIQRSPAQNIQMTFSEMLLNPEIPDSLFFIPEHIVRQYKGEPTTDAVRALLNEGRALHGAGELEKALKVYDKAIKTDHTAAVLYNARGLVYMDLKKYYDAINDFSRALELAPSFANALNNRGLAKYNLNDFGNALEDFNQSLALDSTLAVAYSNRGLVYLQTEEYDKAHNDFLTATELDPDKAMYHYNLGVSAAEMGLYEKALGAYRKSMQLGMLTASVYNYKGVSEYQLEQYDSAVVSFLVAIKMDKESATYHENLGRTYYELAQYKDSEKQFQLSLEIDPDQHNLYNMLGLCSFSEENYKASIKRFSQAIELNPDNALYFDNRASAREELEDYEGAIADCSESIKLYPNDPAVFYKRGMLKIYTSKKIEGCLDLATANEMEYEPAHDAIIENCH